MKMQHFRRTLSAFAAAASLCLGANAAMQLTLNDGDTLQGVYEDYGITIAAGATVTFNNATVTRTTGSDPAVRCDGDATIVLAPGSVNSVDGSATSYAGICIYAYSSGSDTTNTLTIAGTGALTVLGGNQSAGIGGNGWNNSGYAGNIVIAGGTVTATGGDYSAGIGSGYRGTCGNITITGGTVTAEVDRSTGDSTTCTAAIGAGCRGECGNILISGGIVVADAHNGYYRDDACAIGATYSFGKCGDITITDGITSVTATKGATAQQHIGQGDGSATVGTITYGSHLKQTLSNNDLTVTVEPNWVEIGNVTQLKTVANDLSGFYRLTADIDLANESWRFGTFTGVFDGNGHTIRNIYCVNPWDSSGFFQTLGDGAIVRNLSLRGGEVRTNNGYIGGLAGTVSGTVLVEDCTIEVLVSGSGYVGGFVGHIQGDATLTLRRCRSLSAVVGRDRVGGLVGATYWKTAIVNVESCYVAGSVNGSGWVGGIVGSPSNSSPSLFTISNSYSVAELTGFGSSNKMVGELHDRVVIIDTPTILDCFPKNKINVRMRGSSTNSGTSHGTASYNAETGEFTATPSVGSAFYGWEGLPPKEGEYNERTVWAVFGQPVATADDFKNMDANGIYVQTADIDLEQTKGYDYWTFYGCYNGGGHEIRNLKRENDGNYGEKLLGVFEQMEGAVVKNVRIVNPDVSGNSSSIGALAGKASNSTFINVRVEGGSVKGGGSNIGGLVGQAETCLFVECMSSATVEGLEAVGGLIGYGGGDITVRRSYATGDVTGTNNTPLYIGGLIGNGYRLNISDSYALGSVTADTDNGYAVGGFVGCFRDHEAYAAITNCYSAGAVSGNNNLGGFVSPYYTDGKSDGAGNYWDTETSGQATSAGTGVTGLTTAQMKSGTAFAGWDTDVWKFAEGQYPRLRAFIPKHTVTWLDEDGVTVLKEEIVDEGDTPVCEAPTKEATVQYAYEFAGWDPEVVPVESDATYTATYDESVREYAITWLDDEGLVVATESVPYGTTPSCAAPTKASTAQYDYEFAGWDPAVVTVAGEATYTATFTPVLRSYTITWQDDSGATIGTDEVAYGETPSHADLAKPADAQYTYTFAGWTPAIAAVTGDATYTAQFSETVNTYTITWLDYDDSTIKTETLEYGATPTCATPSRADDTYSTYTFLEWMPAVASVTGEATYTATYMMHSKWTGQGTVYEPYTLTTPARIGEILALDEGSTPEIFVNVGGDITSESITANLPAGYAVRTTDTAGVVKVVQILEVVWYDDDGTVLRRDEVDAGDMPSYGSTPAKASTAQYDYEFAGWTPEIVEVTESAAYTATYTETLRSYTIAWLDADGTTLGTTTVAYGETPTHAAPSSVYTFTGWTPSVAEVTGEATYTATYSQEVLLANLTGDYKAVDGDVLTGATAYNVSIPGGATVTVNGVSVTGEGGGAAPEDPSFSDDAETVTARFEKGADGKWRIVAFAELATGTAEGAGKLITILGGDAPDAVTTELAPDSIDIVNAVKVEAVVTPPSGKDSQFFKVEFGE